MENSIYIYHHLGLGDHFLCNGIVRTYAERYDKVFLFAKPRNNTNVVRLYKDLTKLKVLPLDDPDVRFFMQINPNNNYKIIGITPEWFRKLDVEKAFLSFDHGFYVAADVPFEDKWNKFYFERDIESEKNAYYNRLNLKDEEEYLFVHDDRERGRYFKPETIEKGIKIIRATDYKDVGIFDFIYTIEHAKEVHVMNSSFSCLIDTMQIKNDHLFYHHYARTDMGENPNHQFKLNWTILK